MEVGLGRVSDLAGTSETREDEEAPVQEEGEEGLESNPGEGELEFCPGVEEEQALGRGVGAGVETLRLHLCHFQTSDCRNSGFGSCLCSIFYNPLNDFWSDSGNLVTSGHCHVIWSGSSVSVSDVCLLTCLGSDSYFCMYLSFYLHCHIS